MLDARQNGIPDSSSFHSLLVCLAAICYGSITVGARYFDQIGFSWFEISFLIVFVPLPLVPFVLLRSDFRVSPGQLGFFLVFGVIGAGLQLAQYLGIVLAMPVAVVALLLYSQPIWTVVLGRLILGEPVTSRKLAALGLAVLGTILLLEPWNARADYNLWGVLGGVAGGLLLSLWVIWGRLSSLRRQHFISSAFGYTAFSALFLWLARPLLSGIGLRPELLRLDVSVYREHWTAVAIYTVIAGLLPICLTFAGLRKLEASRAGLLMLLEPISAALAAWLAFSERLTSGIYWGGALILLANYVQLVGRRNLPR